MSTRKIVVFTTRSGPVPAAASTATRLASAWRASAAASPPPTSSPLAGSSAICPEQKTIPPARIACEYGPIAAGAPSVEIAVRLADIHRVYHIALGGVRLTARAELAKKPGLKRA